MKISKYLDPNIIGDSSIEGDKKIKNYPPLWKGTGKNSVAQNYSTNDASGTYSHAEGHSTIASGVASHAEGDGTNASGLFSHAEGSHTTASGEKAHAEGSHTTASGEKAHAEGNNTIASGYVSHAEGSSTTASGKDSHAEGSVTTASTWASHAEGWGTNTSNDCEHAEGKFNKPILGKTIHTIGIGASNENRINAHEIRLDGKHYIFGIGGYDGTNSQTKGIKTLQEVVNGKQGKLIAGAGIEISQDNTIACTLDTTAFVVVDSLPTTPEAANTNKIHLVKESTVEGNLFSEYLWVEEKWEKLGAFRPSVDLANYAKKQYVDEELAKKWEFTDSPQFNVIQCNAIEVGTDDVIDVAIGTYRDNDYLGAGVILPYDNNSLQALFVATPTRPNMAATKAYVDNLISQMQATIDALTQRVAALENIISQTAVQE